MIINHNISALNAWRNLYGTNSALSRSMERLSSGFRINRAADDAAGLAISEKMRGQIRGLNMAVKNAQDGISLIQTAEGALNEVHSMLQRMEELAVQAANDTNTPSDRAKLQAEMDELAKEVARIGQTTEFNSLRLLDGTFESKDIVFHIGAIEDQNLRIRIADARSFDLGLAGKVQAQVNGTRADGGDAAQDIANGTYTVQQNGATYELVNTSGTVVATSANGMAWTGTGPGGDDTIAFTDPVTSGTVTIAGAVATGTAQVNNTGVEAGVYTVDTDGATFWNLLDQNANIVATSADGMTWDDAKDPTVTVFTTATVLADNASVTVGGLDIASSQTAANNALPGIRAALENVSSQRSLLGATQNRLDHTISNLQVAVENLQAAESRIRDTDMAREMTDFTRSQILQQAGTAMLAQANAAPQAVLQLLR